MAKHLDLEEQEQLAELKHFWNRFGNLITWTLIVVFGSVAAWNGWQHWQRSQALQASVLYDEVERAAQASDIARVQRGFDDIKDRFSGTAYARQAGLLAAHALYEQGKPEAAKLALGWVAAQGADAGHQSLARLRLAGLLLESKAYDEAMAQLSVPFPKEFEALAADRRGDVLNLQGKREPAKAEYLKALQAIEARADYRQLVEVKLVALGGDPKAADATANAGAVKQ